MQENFSEEEKRKRMAKDLIIRKSLLNGQSSKVAKDNVQLKDNIKNVAKDFLRKGNSSEN